MHYQTSQQVSVLGHIEQPHPSAIQVIVVSSMHVASMTTRKLVANLGQVRHQVPQSTAQFVPRPDASPLCAPAPLTRPEAPP
jgi:hypothetical protein